jgi:hypothetical protein
VEGGQLLAMIAKFRFFAGIGLHPLTRERRNKAP